MAAFARTDLDLLGPRPARQPGGGAAVRDPRRQGARARRVPARHAARRDRRGGRLRLPAPVLRPRHERPAGDRDPARRCPDAADLERFLADRRAARTTRRGRRPPTRPTTRTENLTVPRPDAVRVTRRRTRAVGRGRAGPARRAAAGRAAAAHAARDAQRRGDARARAGALARRPGQDARRPRGARRRARRCRACPARIECYDVSNFQGSETVASMVVFEDGKPRTGEYRRFRVRTVEGPNDVASHREVLRRRFRGARPGDEGSAEERRWAMPDLVLIDGGKPQVGAAKAVLDELGLHDLPLAGLAKEREELVLPGPSRARRCCPRPRRRCTSSSASATRPTASRSPTTATSGARPRSARSSTTCRASGRAGAARCSASSAR